MTNEGQYNNEHSTDKTNEEIRTFVWYLPAEVQYYNFFLYWKQNKYLS